MPKLTYLGNIFHVTEEHEDIVDAVISKGSSLSHGQRLYFESADFDVQGNAIMKRHEITSPDNVPERLRIDNILLRHRNITKEQARQYKDYMLRSDFTYPAAIAEMDKRLRAEGVDNTCHILRRWLMRWKPAMWVLMMHCITETRMKKLCQLMDSTGLIPCMWNR